MWNENILYLPFNYEKKLINRYGKNWRIPQNSKGPMPHKTILQIYTLNIYYIPANFNLQECKNA